MYYDYKKIEKKWQQHWLDTKMFKTLKDNNLPRFYCLDMFPYPSAHGLHVGHIEGYTATDIVSRYKRMKGYNVLHPFGYDAFGLPAEQYAIITGNDPREFTYKNIANFKKQTIESGMGIDWDREFSTADPDFFRWTQWIFKKLYENGLAELKDIEVNWCEELGTVLANDEILIKDGRMVSERGEHPVVKKKMTQWVLKITAYADRLLDDLELTCFPENIKEMQRNWIGKSTGAIINFMVASTDETFDVFTTRADTVYGATYCVLAPEHPLVLKISSADEIETVREYIKKTTQKNDLDRQIEKEKTGVFTGAFAVNPFSNEKIPIWIADYVLPHYGTGAVMAVPAHDERDFEFANIYGLDIIQVIKGDFVGAFTGDGIHYNSEIINNLNNDDAKAVIIKNLEKRKIGYQKDNYKLRDWVFSRQRYWGEPFPVVFDKAGNIHLMDDKDLPLELPKMKNIRPSGTGESPLVNDKEWLYVEYNGIKGKRDTNTMPQLAGSSWYYIAHILKDRFGYIPLDSKEAKEELQKWLPVDLYMGGAEHAVGHLLYVRFWHKFLYDLGIVLTKEPFKKLINQGMILGDDHTKMSKSKGNVVVPDDIFESHGADSLRLYEMFMGPIESEKPWSVESLDGAKKFLDRVWRMFNFEITDHEKELDFIFHKTVQKVTDDIEKFSFNTAISQMMIFVNEVYKLKRIGKLQARGFLQLLNPICPHITEELNKVVLKFNEELVYSSFPEYDLKYLVVNMVEVVIQINGKLRGKLDVHVDTSNEHLQKMALQLDNVKKHLEGLEIKKVIVIDNKLVNIVAI